MLLNLLSYPESKLAPLSRATSQCINGRQAIEHNASSNKHTHGRPTFKHVTAITDLCILAADEVTSTINKVETSMKAVYHRPSPSSEQLLTLVKQHLLWSPD